MKEFELKATKVENVEFINKLPPNTKIELSNKYSYNVGYSKLNTCAGEFRAEIFDKNSPDTFRLTVIYKGFFATAPDTEKERLHVATYNALFPYVRAFVSTLTVNSGMPPINMPFIDISEQSIYRVQMPDFRKDNEENS
ncbi:MAG: hypothetical protein E7573_07510 [Ruminococcaceae bacterium]|nr:hypothetical protein [Oscillospiraceae bacterium]MBR3596283.1 protein-export chaperone SecB [Clostridia bacterium]